MENNLIKYLESINPESKNYNLKMLIDSGVNVIDDLKNFDLFKSVKKINLVESPMYLGDESGKPLTKIENYLGESGKCHQVVELMCNLEKNNFNLNEEIDLYSIEPSMKCYIDSDLDCGVWNYPQSYNGKDFSVINKILIIYSLNSIMDIKKISKDEAKKHAKEIILKQISEIFDNDKESNLPYTQNVKIRCSSRSIKIKQ